MWLLNTNGVTELLSFFFWLALAVGLTWGLLTVGHLLLHVFFLVVLVALIAFGLKVLFYTLWPKDKKGKNAVHT